MIADRRSPAALFCARPLRRAHPPRPHRGARVRRGDARRARCVLLVGSRRSRPPAPRALGVAGDRARRARPGRRRGGRRARAARRASRAATAATRVDELTEVNGLMSAALVASPWLAVARAARARGARCGARVAARARPPPWLALRRPRCRRCSSASVAVVPPRAGDERGSGRLGGRLRVVRASGDASLRAGLDRRRARARSCSLVVGVVALMVDALLDRLHGRRRGLRRATSRCCRCSPASMTLLVIADALRRRCSSGGSSSARARTCSSGSGSRSRRRPRRRSRRSSSRASATSGCCSGSRVLWTATGTLGYAEVLAQAAGALPRRGRHRRGAAAVRSARSGKSAQFPLHIWLPDAMEGPTPVSALIHAATMVAAGVFLVARTWPLFEASPTARDGRARSSGVITALGAATIARGRRRDIKKVLAYSTISQLGFMFAALGRGCVGRRRSSTS